MKSTHRKGMSLLELISVLVLLCMFAAAISPAYHAYLAIAQTRSCASIRTEALVYYLEFCSLPGNGGTTFSDYASSSYGDADKLCPGGGECTCGRQNGQPHLYCTVHEPDMR